MNNLLSTWDRLSHLLHRDVDQCWTWILAQEFAHLRKLFRGNGNIFGKKLEAGDMSAPRQGYAEDSIVGHGLLWAVRRRSEHASFVNIKGFANIVCDSCGCSGGQADDTFSLDLLDEAGN
jgi:hypothetical protein